MQYDSNQDHPELPLSDIQGRLKTAGLWKQLVEDAAESLPSGFKKYSVRMVYEAARLWLESELDSGTPPLVTLSKGDNIIDAEMRQGFYSAKLNVMAKAEEERNRRDRY
ncbi:MAG: hypothetical protein KGJ06_04945 [Pseudomonadota bacterium]|nr:hypothetical protein [Pseudomonadota bacterium]